MIGTKVSHYTIMERIGAGGMGEVYKAFDPRLDRVIALKILNPAAMSDEGKRQRFMQEARAVSALNHPNILTIHEIGVEQDRLFIATEYIEGYTLRRRLREGQLPISSVLDIAIQIAKALGVAHQAGIIHRDIKPENIMVRPDGYVKVLDFGLVKLAESTTLVRQRGAIIKTENNIILGTIRYMAPEQVQHLPIDHRVDLFAFGVVLYEMLTGELPFNGNKAVDIAYEIISNTPSPLSEYVSGNALLFQPILTRCLEKDVNARYQDAERLLKDLRLLQRQIELSQKMPGGDLKPLDFDTGRAISATGARASVVVVGLANLAGDAQLDWWRAALAELLTIRLMNNIQLDMVTNQQVVDILDQLGHDKGDIDKPMAWEIARRTGAEICIHGSYIFLVTHISVSIHLQDVLSGRVLASLASRCVNSDGIFGLVDDLALKIERELAVGRNEGESPAVTDLLTGSVVALQAFQRGLAHYRQGEWEQAERHLYDAIAVDTRFSVAYYYLARVCRILEKPEARRFLDSALEFSGRAGVKERLIMALEKASFEQDYATQLRLAEDLIVQAPREKIGYLYLAEAYHWRGECERAFVIYQQALAFDTRSIFQGARAMAGISPIFENYLDTGNFERAEQAARAAISVQESDWLAHLSLGIVLYYRRAYGDADHAFMRAKELNNGELRYAQFWQARIKIQEHDFAGARQLLENALEGIGGWERLLYWRELAEVMREQGHLREWYQLLTQEQELFTCAPVLDGSFAPQYWRAFFFEQIGQLDQALAEYQNLLNRLSEQESNMTTDITTAVWARMHVGRLLAAQGKFDITRQLAEQIRAIGSSLPNPKIERLSLFLLGAIEFHQGNYQAAADLLERSIWSYYNGFALAIRMLAQCFRQLRKFDRALELLMALQPYGTVTGNARFCSRTQLDLEIAKTYEASKQIEQAITYYRRCLQAWPDADKDFIGREEAEAGLMLLSR